VRRLRDAKERPFYLNDAAFPDTGGLLKTGLISLFLHLVLVIILILSLKTEIRQSMATVYRVSLRPFSPPGGGILQASPGPGASGPSGGLPSPAPVEKMTPIENTKRREVVGGIKPQRKKAEKIGEKSEEGEKLDKRKESLKSLQEAIEDIHKRAALDEIQKRVALREKAQRPTTERQSVGEQPAQGPIGSSRSSSLSGSGTRTGSGSGTGTGSGSGGGPIIGGPPGDSSGGGSLLESKLNDYYGTIWVKIKKEWTLPENIPKGEKSLEAIIVVIVERGGKIQKSWFEKRSGNALYDQMAMRAIRKAEPFPPIPEEFTDNTFEIGIRFHPD
jgi:colicin import membrane protein